EGGQLLLRVDASGAAAGALPLLGDADVLDQPAHPRHARGSVLLERSGCGLRLTGRRWLLLHRRETGQRSAPERVPHEREEEASLRLPPERTNPAEQHHAVLRVCGRGDRKSTRLNSSHVKISYAVFC